MSLTLRKSMIVSWWLIISSYQLCWHESGSGTVYWMWPCCRMTTIVITMITWNVLLIIQHWQRLAPSGPDRPKGRWSHAATFVTQSQLGIHCNLLLLVGGYIYDDSWICNLNDVKWMKVSVACKWAVIHALTHHSHSSEDCKDGCCVKYALLWVVFEVGPEFIANRNSHPLCSCVWVHEN